MTVTIMQIRTIRSGVARRPIPVFAVLAALTMASVTNGAGSDEQVVDLPPYPTIGEGGLFATDSGHYRQSGRSLQRGTEFSGSRHWLPSELLEERAPLRLEELFDRIPGASAPARFGVVTVPNLRGDAAETYYNGQRRSGNLFGWRPNLNSVSSIEVLSGVASLWSGSGKRTGGAVNYLTKTANPLSGYQRLSLTLGEWVPDDRSWISATVAWEGNFSLSESRALLVAVEMQYSDTDWHKRGAREDHIDSFLNHFQTLQSGWEWSLSGGFLRQNSPQTLGFNRPWQGLIDHRLYIPGTVDPDIGQSDPPGPLDPGVADPGLLTGTVADAVLVNRRQTLFSRGDGAQATAVWAQSILRNQSHPEWHWTQRTLVDYTSRHKENAFLFIEDVTQWTTDLQFEANWFPSTLDLLERWDFMVHLRHEGRDNYSNYWNEFAYAFDILEGDRHAALEDFGAWIAPGWKTGPRDKPYYSPSSGTFATPETSRSDLVQAGFVTEQRWHLHRHYALVAGFRVDRLRADARDPLPEPQGPTLRDRKASTNLSGQIQLEATWSSRLAGYLLLQRGESMAGNTVGDGINLYPDVGIHREDLRNRLQLVEAGLLTSLVDDRLFLRAAAYEQERVRNEFFGANDIRVQGMDLSLSWTPHRQWKVETGVSWIDAHYINAAPAEFGGASLGNVYAPGAGPDQLGNGLGYIGGFFLNSVPAGNWRVPGLSRWNLSSSIRWSFHPGWQVRLWGQWQSAQRGNLLGEYHIPSQYELHSALQWASADWRISLRVLNLTNTWNWVHNGDTFFDNLLIATNRPRRVSLHLERNF